MRKKRTIYLGFDGAYVLSLLPIVKKYDGKQPYLAHKGRKRYQTLDVGVEGHVVFGDLGLEPFEVVKLEVSVGKSAQAKTVRS